MFAYFQTKDSIYIFSDKGQYLSMAGKGSLKDKLEDDELDLSMMQLSEVPVRVRSDYIKRSNYMKCYHAFQDIELLGQKVMTVNLSHNLLTR